MPADCTDSISVLAPQIAILAAENAALKDALRYAIKVADEARAEWDAAPSRMRAGKIIIALSGKCPGYRADIDAIHRAASKAME